MQPSGFLRHQVDSGQPVLNFRPRNTRTANKQTLEEDVDMAFVRRTRRSQTPGPFAELDRLQGELNRLFQAVWGPERWWRPQAVFPPVNVSEDKDNVYVRAEVPGVKPADLEISITGDTLTLSGRRTTEEVSSGAAYHRRERDSGTFQRVVTLPMAVDPDAVKAQVRDGVLSITLPKHETAKPRQIRVETEGAGPTTVEV